MKRTNRILVALLALLVLGGCGDEDLSSSEDARRAYLGLEKMIDKAIDLGFKGFNAATSANIPDQSTTGEVSGALVVGGKVDQGSSSNKEMRLHLTLTEYSDIDGFIYNTGSANPALEMSLKKIPDGTMTGTLNGKFAMTGELEGEVVLALTIAAQLEPDPKDSSKVRRKPGTITVTGTATSAYGTYAVNLKL
jgi:hypothetical protein